MVECHCICSDGLYVWYSHGGTTFQRVLQVKMFVLRLNSHLFQNLGPLPNKLPPLVSRRAGRRQPSEPPNYDPISWQKYWDRQETVELPNAGGTLNVYCKGSAGPILLLIHGGGYSGIYSIRDNKRRLVFVRIVTHLPEPEIANIC